MGSWVRTITTPFRKVGTILNPPREKKPQPGIEHHGVKLHGEVMACTYEDVRVMWSILEKSKSGEHNPRS